MRLELRNPYKSLDRIAPVQLPEFTVVVGLNGAGKSQLLEALQRGEADCDRLQGVAEVPPGMPDPQVVKLTNAGLNLSSETYVMPEHGRDRPLTKATFIEHQSMVFKGCYSTTEMLKGSSLETRDILDVIGMSAADLISSISQAPNGYNEQHVRQFIQSLNSGLASSQHLAAHAAAQQGIARVVKRTGKEARFITFEEALEQGSWGPHELFNAQLPPLFARYRDEKAENRKARQANPSSALSDDDFIRTYGPPPWEQLDDLLDLFGIDYKLSPPGHRTIDTVTLHFDRRNNPDIHVTFSSLSAGEKVLVVLAVALLNVDPVRFTTQKPRLLLLDEIDASLHPAVLHRWMTTIEEKVVGELGIACIMTTHSPITVALAPENALFEMSRSSPRFVKVNKRSALNSLTVGLPAVELDLTRRRQVFVEAEVDAQAYDQLYAIIKSQLNSQFALSFLSTGVTKDDGLEQGTGCAAVRKVVDTLVGSGNLSAFGLLDWDGSTESSARIVVLGEESHYALDNIILNPLLIGLLLKRDSNPLVDHLPRFGDAEHLTNSQLQQFADLVQDRAFSEQLTAEPRRISSFLDGREILVTEEYCTINGHVLEDRLQNNFPALRRYTGKGRGKLALAVVDKVLRDYPCLCPAEIVTAFHELAA